MSFEPSSHELTRMTLGPYVLGQLSMAERARVELHLAGCASCRHELAELGPVGLALGDVKRASQRAALPEPTDQLRARVFADITASRPTRRLRVMAGSAAVGVLIAASVVAGLQVADVVRIERGEATQLAATGESVRVVPRSLGIKASAELINHTWGVEVVMQGTGFKAGQRYQVFVLDEGGRRFVAGEFVGVGKRAMTCRLNSAVLRSQASGFVVQEGRGRIVVTSDFDAVPRSS